VKRLLQLIFGSQFDESLRINVRVPVYFNKLRSLMQAAKREYVVVVFTHMPFDMPFS